MFNIALVQMCFKFFQRNIRRDTKKQRRHINTAIISLSSNVQFEVWSTKSNEFLTEHDSSFGRVVNTITNHLANLYDGALTFDTIGLTFLPGLCLHIFRA